MLLKILGLLIFKEVATLAVSGLRKHGNAKKIFGVSSRL